MARAADGADRRAAQRRVDPELPDTRLRRVSPLSLVAVAAGGVAGTALRYGIGRAFPAPAGTFPWATFVINVSGSFVLGAFLGWLLARRPTDRHLRPLVAVGFLGGYTTFSTAMVESAVLVKDGHAPVAVAYLVLGSAAAFAAVALGVTGAPASTPMLIALLLVGGAVGAPARYLVDAAVQDRVAGAFPWGTFVINVSGSFVLGVLTGLVLYHGLGDLPRVAVGTGFCGAYTTFSTYSYETVRLLEDGDVRLACLNAFGSVLVGFAAAAAGLALMAAW